MNWTWGEAWGIAGVGFGVVFLVLVILAIAIFITGLVVKKIESKTSKEEEKS